MDIAEQAVDASGPDKRSHSPVDAILKRRSTVNMTREVSAGAGNDTHEYCFGAQHDQPQRKVLGKL
jgi:hypothetical protein